MNITYCRRVRELASNAGVDLDDALLVRHIEDFSASMGISIEESVEHMIGALEYMNRRTPSFILDSISDLEPRVKVNWKKEGF